MEVERKVREDGRGGKTAPRVGGWGGVLGLDQPEMPNK